MFTNMFEKTTHFLKKTTVALNSLKNDEGAINSIYNCTSIVSGISRKTGFARFKDIWEIEIF